MVNAMKRLGLPIALLALASCSLWAQAPPPSDQGQDDPADVAEHGVARISLTQGNVSVTRGDSGEQVSSALNAPLVSTDRVLTGDNARAEVQFDSANLIRIAPGSEVRLGDLQYQRILVQVAQGTATFRVLRDNDVDVEISTPSISLRPLRQGIYRVTVTGDGNTQITVRAGEAEVFSPSGSERLSAGQTMHSRGPASDPEFMTVAAIPFDDWDRWNSDRDRYFERGNEVSRYVSPDVYGTEELAGNGRWVWDPAYGNVWVPAVDGDWAPYHNGRWSWVDYYGWSWVSYDPWGWAPYHYGSWYRGNYGWAWYPGALSARHYWRPAMVGFFGYGSPGFGVSVGFGFSNVGWVPLSPFDRYRPWYGRGLNGGRNSINIISNTNIANVYRNARYREAVTGLRAGDFGRTGGGNFLRPSQADVSRAGIVDGRIPFGASREGRQLSNAAPRNDGLPRGNNNNRFFSTPNGAGNRVPNAPPNPGAGFQRFENRGAAPQFRNQEPVQIRPPIVTERGNQFRNEGGNPQAPRFQQSAPPQMSAPPRAERQVERQGERRNFERQNVSPPQQGNPGNFGAPRRFEGGAPPAGRVQQGGGGGGGRPAAPSGGGNRGQGGGHGGGNGGHRGR
jgi:uncharacterized protein DUF6600/FecR-like protein